MNGGAAREEVRRDSNNGLCRARAGLLSFSVSFLISSSFPDLFFFSFSSSGPDLVLSSALIFYFLFLCSIRAVGERDRSGAAGCGTEVAASELDLQRASRQFWFDGLRTVVVCAGELVMVCCL
jgi:hypothetical protein